MNRQDDAEGPDSRFLCVGYSHVATVEKGAAALGVSVATLNFWRHPEGVVKFWEPTDPTTDEQRSSVFSAEVVQRFRSFQGPVCALLASTAHLLIGTLAHPRPFDFVLPKEPERPMDPDAEVIPSLAVRRILERLSKPFLAQLTELAGHCDGPIFHLEPPPPTFDSKRIEKHVPWDWFPGMRREVAPPSLRYKLWRLHSEVVAAACAPIGVEFVPVPKESQDGQGYLRDRYFEDGTHGNVLYGELMVRQIEERL